MKIGIVIPTKMNLKYKIIIFKYKKNLKKKGIVLCFVDKSDDDSTIKKIKEC